MQTPPLDLPVPGERCSRTISRYRDQAGPVVPVKLPGGVDAWLVTSYEAISEILAHDDTHYSKNPKNFPALHDGTIPAGWPMRQLIEGDHLLNKDGGDHRRLRGLIARGFTPARVQALAPRVAELAEELLARMPAAGEPVDLVRHFAEPLPVIVICELFGVPEEDREEIRTQARLLVSHDTAPDDAARAGARLLGHLAGHIERRRREPADDLTSALIRAQDEDGDRLSDTEMLWILWLMILAGHETTVHLIGNSVVALCSHPDQLARARAEGSWERVVEEVMRSRASVVSAVFRYTLREVTIAGVTVPAGQALAIGFGATGTDPARFGAAAGCFDVSRAPETHLGFGRGPHFCVGAPLARLEGRIALAALFRRFPGLRLAVEPGEIAYSPSLITEGPLALPVLLAG
ncbi:cytochrome P450 [Actinomadura sp. ATCC 31491]|uniref:Cytochrome P450 n=1 Tax=Actinomadura luzonensis TaxID=2805427 RepID=A0ABT0G618_9ACTN|nr:cytochrome P450 [Actinomadura luzonensis]MCK2220062.1 cytochrome P450 [Actinomadura luzonensis]